MADTFSGEGGCQGEPKVPPSACPGKSGQSAVVLLVFLSLIVVGMTLFAHWPVLSAKAMSFDDEEAVVQNYLVQHPSWNSVRRFFSEVLLSSVVQGYYRPLTLTSLMLDWAMGARPEDLRVFHSSSLALHLGSTVLVILLCYQLFRQPFVAAMVGLLFGVHPLTVEPVAWVMERKTLLAALFALAALNAYVAYARGHRRGWFAAALVFFLLSLLSKPTSTPLPLMMLLMDYWPLNRLKRRAVLEKIPFFALSTLFAVLCCVCEQRVNPLSLPVAQSPLYLPLRVCYLIVFYFSKMLLPIHLSSVYMLPEPLTLRNPIVVLAVAGTVVLIAALAASRRWTPALWVGAAIWLVGVAPTMGLVGYSWAVASDKYVYLPAVGPLLVLGWLLARICSGGTAAQRAVRRARTAAAVLIVAGLLAAGTRSYLGRWQTTEGLFDYMLALAPNSSMLHHHRGNSCEVRNLHDTAIREYTQAIELKPDFAELYDARGTAYLHKGYFDEAIRDYTRAIAIAPGYADAYYNRGNAYNGRHDYRRAIPEFTEAIRLKPGFLAAYNNRAYAYQCIGEPGQAILDYTRLVELSPDDAVGWNNRGDTYYSMRDYARAVRDLTRAIEVNPGFAGAYHNRAVAYFSLKEDEKAWADVKMCRQLGDQRPISVGR